MIFSRSFIGVYSHNKERLVGETELENGKRIRSGVENNVYDIGLYGLWSQCNYGSMIAYYALHQYLTERGHSVLMLELPAMGGQPLYEHGWTHARRFAEEHYTISHVYSPQDMWKYNQMCEQFLLGPDQLWNFGVSRNYGRSFYFDFVEDFKPKLAYGVSFGHEIDFTPAEEKQAIRQLLQRFDSIAVREDDSVRLLEAYGVRSAQVVDPVFLLPSSAYETLGERATLRPQGDYIAACISDPTPEANECVKALSEQYGGMPVVALLDGNVREWEEKTSRFDFTVPDNAQLEDYLYVLCHAKAVITDAYHALCLSLLFRRPFVAIPNRFRGYSRFDSLARQLPIRKRYCYYDAEEIRRGTYRHSLDFVALEARWRTIVAQSRQWLVDNVE